MEKRRPSREQTCKPLYGTGVQEGCFFQEVFHLGIFQQFLSGFEKICNPLRKMRVAQVFLGFPKRGSCSPGSSRSDEDIVMSDPLDLPVLSAEGKHLAD